MWIIAFIENLNEWIVAPVVMPVKSYILFLQAENLITM